MYVVKSGDYLKGIATKLHVALTDLLQVNKITVNSVIFPGDKLTVPAGGVLPASSTATTPANSPASASSTATRTGTSTPSTTSTGPQNPAASTSYVVQNGDYLFGIATNHGVTVPALLAANKLTVHSVILPGFTLSIPPATLPIPASATTPTVVPTPAQGSTGTQPAASIATVLAFLQAQLGKPYVFNTAGPDTYDCSGLVTAAYLQIGISLPHQSLLQSTKGTVVDFHNAPILAGDLIFQYSSAKPDVISHVGIAISATQWVQAARTGDFVKISPMPSFDRIVTVRRIVPAA